MKSTLATLPAPQEALWARLERMVRGLSGRAGQAAAPVRAAAVPQGNVQGRVRGRVPEFQGAAVEGLSVVLVGKPGGVLNDTAAWLLGNRASLTWLPPSPDAIDVLAGNAAAGANVAILDLDAVGDIRDVLDSLLMLRRLRPGLAVILVSRGFHADDVSTERLPVCDCSLRVPVSFASLDFALNEAIEVNNPVWQASVRDAGFAHG